MSVYLRKKAGRALLTLVVVSICLYFRHAGLPTLAVAQSDPVNIQSGSEVIRVAPSGSDTAGCGSEGSPCRTIQYAINLASSDDTILVATGTYTFSDVGNWHKDCDVYTTNLPVACVINKHLTLLGGYNTDNWSVADPESNPTIIDGENSHRGVTLAGTSTTQVRASLHMEGFTIRNGRAQGATSGEYNQISGYGGGMYAVNAPVALSNMVFTSNKALGGSTSQAYGGAGVGGGLAVNGVPSGNTCMFENVTFDGNEARGGSGLHRGGSALGGGFLVYSTVLEARHITLTDNTAWAGSSSGSGLYWCTADGLGGGAAIHLNSVATLEYVAATGNQAIGGNAGQASDALAGAGHGGALYAEQSTVSLSDSDLRENLALGGDAANGYIGGGGGIMSANANVTIARTTIAGNTARGGNGTTGHNGAASGGGVHLARFTGNTMVSIINSVIADNLVEQGATGSWSGGGGGGLWLQGLQVDITRTTIAGNGLGPGVYGEGALFVNFGCDTPTVANVSYSIIADHTDGRVALHAWMGNTVNLHEPLFANNSYDTNEHWSGSGTFNWSGTVHLPSSAGFISPGPPYYNYHILLDSSAKDQAGGVTEFDVDRQPCTWDGTPDLGADEYWPFALFATPGDGTLRLNWGSEAHILAGGVDHYELRVTCEPGASPPNEIGCGESMDFDAATTTFELTGLTNFKGYTIEVDAEDASHNVIAESMTVTGIPTDIFVYLPLVTR